MKTRKLLLLSTLVLSVAACQRIIEQQPVTPPDGEHVIALSSGVALGRAANVGIRSVFEAGDQIGVIAVYATVPALGGADPVAPNWEVAPHFENVPAAHVSNDATSPAITTFGWGPAAEGGKDYNQYYPSAKKEIYLYSYYPYSATNLDKPIYEPINIAGADDLARQPKLGVALVHGAIDGTEASVLKKQPDVLYYIPAAAVSSASVSGAFTYQHALAQIRFTIKRPVGSKACTFKQLVFKSVAKGKLNLATGKVTVASSANRTEAIYTITMSGDSTARAVPESDPAVLDPAPAYLDVLNPAKSVDFNYLMVLPLSQEDAEKGELVLTCNFGSETDQTKEELMNFTIPLATRLKPFEAGKLNTLALTVSQFAVSVAASINPWANGETAELPAE